MSEETVTAVPEKQQKSEPKEDAREKNLTISTKLSTDQLICKTPQESPSASIKSLKNDDIVEKKIHKVDEAYNYLLYLGTSQILFGLLMAVFGALVLFHEAKLAHLGGGLWGGCLAVISGTTGVLAAAKNWCPLRGSAQKVAHTAFLALSLISLAVSQLVVVVAATGLARDINRSIDNESEDEEGISETLQSKEIFSNFPSNYLALLSNAGLLIVSSVQCVCSAVASYQSSRSLCPCFRRPNESSRRNYQFDSKHAFIDSWLGKHAHPPMYVVATPNSTGKRSRLSIAPVYSLPPPPMMGFPLIPAPLGPIPSPVIRPYPKEVLHRKHKRYHTAEHVHKLPTSLRKPRKYRSKSREKQITTEDVVRTYTGLDRTIAEEFIEICDSRNNSLSSDTSCQSSCHSSACTCNTNSTS